MRVPPSPRLLVTSAAILLALTLAVAWNAASAAQLTPSPASPFDGVIAQHARDSFLRGREIFRFDTFGSEAFWGAGCDCISRSSARVLAGSAPG